MPSCHSGSTYPVPTDEPAPTICSKSRWNSEAIAAESTIAITFSCRVQASSLQFVEPVQTASPSRIMYLWCIRSGTPAIASASTGSDAISSSSGDAGGGTGTASA